MIFAFCPVPPVVLYRGILFQQEQPMGAMPLLEIVQILLAFTIALPCVGLALISTAHRQRGL